jgi:hypothetical protein
MSGNMVDKIKKELERLNQLIELGERVLSTRHSPPSFLNASDRVNDDPFYQWKAGSLSFLENVFGEGSTHFRGFQESCKHAAYPSALQGQSILKAAKEDLEGGYLSKDATKESSEIIKILDLAENKLRKTIRDVPQREKNIQDKFEDLLVATDIEYSREQEKIIYSSKTYHPDFCFPKIGTVLEIKLCDKKEREKEIISEINDDIIAYKTKYSNIIFLVYDTGYIRDIDRFKEDIEAEEIVLVRVVKH